MDRKLFEVIGDSKCYSLFGNNGVMKPIKKVRLYRGCKVLMNGYGDHNYVVYDDGMNIVRIFEGEKPEVVESYELEGTMKMKLDGMIKSVDEIFGIGLYYYNDNIPVPDDVIEKSLLHAEYVNKAAAEKKERDNEEAKKLRESLIVEYSYLDRLDKSSKREHLVCGDNIRKELKKHFPGVKFSVRYDSFSGGDSYDIRWQDGPMTTDVDNVVKKFQDSHADYTGDYWDYDPSIFNTLYGGVKFVMAHRERSDNWMTLLLEKYAGLNEESWGTYQGFPKDFHKRDDRSYEDELSRLWCYTDLTTERKTGEKQEKEHDDNGTKELNDSKPKVEIVEYTKGVSFAVVGDTYPLRNILKKNGGTFNRRLRCGAGWVFSNKRRSEVMAALSL